MTTAIATTPAPERKALLVLGDEQIGVRLDGDGFLSRVQRKIRLHYGTELYAATPRPSADSKVAPFQPGYMKIVAAMGGQLVVPPVVRDPLTGEERSNPKVEFYPGTGIMRRVEATALCVVRNPVTGDPHASAQTIIVDGEHIFRQAMLKLGAREDAVRYMTREDYDEARRTELKGWAFLDMGPIGAAYNMRNPAVMEAYQTFTNQSATMRQRACSKAERLACDHNPITRMSWQYDQLRKGPQGPAYAEVTVVAWVENKGQAKMDAFLSSLARQTDAIDGIAELVVNTEVDDGSGEDAFVDAPEAEPGEQAALPDHGEPAAIFTHAPEREKVAVELVKTEPVKAAKSEPKPAATPDIRAEVLALEARIEPKEMLGALRAEAGIIDIADAAPTQLTAYRAVLVAELES